MSRHYKPGTLRSVLMPRWTIETLVGGTWENLCNTSGKPDTFATRHAAEAELLTHLDSMHDAHMWVKFDEYRITRIDPPTTTTTRGAPSCVSVLYALGFEEIGTGGNCTALAFSRPDGEMCMVTVDAQAPTGRDHNWDVGFYKEGYGEHYRFEHYARGHAKGLIMALKDIATWRVG